jgi:geranylgeranyl diphosphate synthase type II
MTDIREYLREVGKRIEKSLQRYLPAQTEFPEKIHEAMRYSVFAGGKRLRPFLVLESCRVCGGSEGSAMPVACAFELVHTYSLIHDDLPAMDNDDFRRGLPTSHRKFGEATAILAGDALLALAFNLLAREVREPEIAQRVILELSAAAGSRGMVGGQALDISEPPQKEKEEYLRCVHEMKTASLITAATRCGAIVAEASPEDFQALSLYGRNLGLAFQITDDILDAGSRGEALDKNAANNQALPGLTYPALYGVKESRRIATELIEKAVSALGKFGQEAEQLRQIAEFVLARES